MTGPSAGPVGDLPPDAIRAAQQVVYDEHWNDLGLANLVVRALTAAMPAIRAHMADQVRAMPRRTGTPEWSSHREVAQAVGYDVGLGAAEAEVRHG